MPRKRDIKGLQSQAEYERISAVTLTKHGFSNFKITSKMAKTDYEIFKQAKPAGF
jgi:hypothetical protein